MEMLYAYILGIRRDKRMILNVLLFLWHIFYSFSRLSSVQKESNDSVSLNIYIIRPTSRKTMASVISYIFNYIINIFSQFLEAIKDSVIQICVSCLCIIQTLLMRASVCGWADNTKGAKLILVDLWLCQLLESLELNQNRFGIFEWI